MKRVQRDSRSQRTRPAGKQNRIDPTADAHRIAVSSPAYRNDAEEMAPAILSAPSLPRHLRSLGALFLSAFLLFVAQGMFLTAVPLRLETAGSSASAVGAVASAYFLGVLSGSWRSGQIVESVGHIRAFAGFAALIISAALCLALVPGVVGVGAVRFFHGWAAAGTFLTMESWLNAATPTNWRGRVVSAYAFLTLGALGLGQLIIAMLGPGGARPVLVGGVLLAASIVPIALGRIRSPVLGPLDPLPLGRMYALAPLGVLTGFAAGLNMGAFWALGPVFGGAFKGGNAGMVMVTVVFGGAILVWPLGALSDQVGRRNTIAISGVTGCVAALALAFGAAPTPVVGLFFLAIYGGVIFSLYPLALSYATDRSSSADATVQLTRGLLLCNGFGMALGPVLGGAAAPWAGPASLFLFAALVSALVLAAAVWRLIWGSAPPAEHKTAFVAMTETTPAALAIDPRIETDGQLAFDFSKADETDRIQ